MKLITTIIAFFILGFVNAQDISTFTTDNDIFASLDMGQGYFLFETPQSPKEGEEEIEVSISYDDTGAGIRGEGILAKLEFSLDCRQIVQVKILDSNYNITFHWTKLEQVSIK